MEIYEKIFSRLQEMHMSQTELSKRTGIATSTISDWRKKKINPQSDKLVPICKALDVSLVDLLCNEDDRNNTVLVKTDNASEIIIEEISNASEDIKNKVFQYYRLLSIRDNFTEQEKANCYLIDKKGYRGTNFFTEKSCGLKRNAYFCLGKMTNLKDRFF